VNRFWALLKETFEVWSSDKAPRLGAAIAYYTVFSLAPLLVVATGVTALVLGQEAAKSAILDQVAAVIGERSASAVQDMLDRAHSPESGALATVLGLVTLLFGASGVFGQLQDALNTIWGVAPKPGRGWLTTIRMRFLSLLAVLGTGFLLLVSLVVSAWIAGVEKVLGHVLPGPESLVQAINFLVSFGLITVLFAMIFKILPDVILEWRDVWIGAAVTSFLFAIGKLLLGFYLAKSDIASGFGAAGSFVLLLVWVYYSAQILLFGAEFTAVYSNAYGSHVRPSDEAVPVPPDSKAVRALKKDRGQDEFPRQPAAGRRSSLRWKDAMAAVAATFRDSTSGLTGIWKRMAA
jgi:membrane protein